MGIKKAIGWGGLLCVIELLLVSGCAELMYGPDYKKREEQRQERARIYFEQNPQLSDAIKSCILNQKIRIGMTKKQVLLSWGQPRDVNRTVGAWGVHEQWVYGSIYAGNYLYFEDGVLTSWQD